MSRHYRRCGPVVTEEMLYAVEGRTIRIPLQLSFPVGAAMVR